MLLVFTTTPTRSEADGLASKIIESGLAACVQILPAMTSVYEWKGEVRSEPEYLLLIKTFSEHWSRLSDLITENHSYEVPEIVAVRAEKISAPYLEWMNGLLR